MRRVYNILLSGFLLAAYPAAAADPVIPVTFKGLYEINLGNVRFAKMGLEFDQDSKGYSVTGDLASTGIVKLFTKHMSHTTVAGSGQDFHYPSREYETNYSTKKKRKYVKVVYANNAVKEEKLDPPEAPGKRPAVSADLKKGSYDPLSFILQMRGEIISALKSGRKDFTLDVYDGRRLTRAHFSNFGKKVITHNGKKTAVVEADVKRELVAGFTDSELDDYNRNEPPLTIYFSDDERFIPLRLETSFWLGVLSATLVKECRTGESCLLGLK